MEDHRSAGADRVPLGTKQALLRVAEMYAADAAAERQGKAGKDLMEMAGRAVADAVSGRWSRRPTVVLCGPGNNGGDGLVAARLLAKRGWPVTLALLGSSTHLQGDAAYHAGLWDGPIHPLTPKVVDQAELVIDALFGAGLSRGLEGAALATVLQVLEAGTPVAAVDMPSGIGGDTGEVVGEAAFRATLTVTFFRKKPGHVLYPGRGLCCETVVSDIGIPEDVLDDIKPTCFENGPELWLHCFSWRRPESHKYDFGHALVRGGGELTGAARLACRAALRVGAGLVSVACPETAAPIYASAFPSLMVRKVGDDQRFADLLQDQRINAVLVGPGNGVVDSTRQAVLTTLEAGKSAVLDADALSVFQPDPQALFDALSGRCVLTPHAGEFARLFHGLEGDKLSLCIKASEASKAVVLLKGADTVIAAPSGRCVINSNAPPDLATAGAGDVLAGLIVGLLARGLPAFEAASAAAWLHGRVAEDLGPGLVAEDLPEALPPVLAALQRLYFRAFGANANDC